MKKTSISSLFISVSWVVEYFDINSQRAGRRRMKMIGTALLVLMVTVSMVVLPACSTINPYTGEKQTSKLATGAGIGAVAGGILGAATASRRTARKGAAWRRCRRHCRRRRW
jgi:hypothetical protein